MAGKPSDYLIVEDPKESSTWHLQVKKNGVPDHTLMGASWAALHDGYRGNVYAGPNKAEALSKLTALYKAEKMPLPGSGKSVTSALADAMLDAALKAGARHSAVDLGRVQAIHDHAKDLGAHCDAANTDMDNDAGKSLALKCLGMPDAPSYAESESGDIGQAAGALSYLASLAGGEAGEDDEDPTDVIQLADIMRALLRFIEGEIGELVQASAVPPAFDAGKTLVAFGGELKSLGNGHIGGYLVRFSGPRDPDLTGDYFDATTDYGLTPGQKTPIFFNHRLPLTARNGDQISIKKKIGEGTLSMDDGGILIDAIIFNREKYERDILKSAKSLGWSSGTAAHLVDREAVGQAFHIKTWLLGLDASLTPTPAEPRNSALSLKSLQAEQSQGRTAPDSAPEGAVGDGEAGVSIPDELLALGQMVKRQAGLLT